MIFQAQPESDSNSANQDIVLCTRASYAAGVIVPAAYFVVDNLAGTNRKAIGTFTNTSTPNATRGTAHQICFQRKVVSLKE